jgi:hypothetical protein
MLGFVPVILFVAAFPEAAAQPFPSRPIRLVVPAAPGGGTDVLARLLSPELTKQFGQQIVIENRAGGATMIGTEFVARSAPDGYTLVIATTPHAINPTLYKKVPFDPVKDFTMISQLGLTTTVLVVAPVPSVDSGENKLGEGTIGLADSMVVVSSPVTFGFRDEIIGVLGGITAPAALRAFRSSSSIATILLDQSAVWTLCCSRAD